MTINIKDLKKKITYRASYRGNKEMDKILSSFIKKYIDTLSSDELIQLANLIKIDDENLYNFNIGKKTSIKINTNKITNLFKKFIYKKE
ncbi:succinate dehydrogenase assembly factor 2 [Candidatus Pelagibacter sp.]|nr:succinate dehydrogenase assembly factor 2 [Candidatus Pelagibacter sp.]